MIVKQVSLIENMNFGIIDKVNVIWHKTNFSASDAVKNDINYSSDFVEHNYSNINNNNKNINNHFKSLFFLI